MLFPKEHLPWGVGGLTLVILLILMYFYSNEHECSYGAEESGVLLLVPK